MLIIRLKRVGRKNHPHYRMVVAEKSRAVGGKFIEILGSIDPHTKTRTLKRERILHWLSNGAQVSDTAYNLLTKEKILTGGPRRIRIRKKKDKGDKEAEPQDTTSQDTKTTEEKTEEKEVQQEPTEKSTEKKEERKDKPEEKMAEKEDTPKEKKENKQEDTKKSKKESKVKTEKLEKKEVPDKTFKEKKDEGKDKVKN